MGSIHVENLGKAYKYYPNRWSRLAEWLLPFAGPRHQLKWVLQNVSFDVAPGNALGIIGINGAGKSTLLKLITGTAHPTTGTVSMSGRVAALLELGMGFHPDFTGRQNAIMAGQLIGLGTEEVTALMPQIEEFAEIGDYIDQPVRIYSSGMQVRLAFSVATAVRPDILIVDEALSVGDAYFQHKSFDRISRYRELGTTLLIVSHDKEAIQSICDRAILLDGGRLVREGGPEEIMDYYNAMIAFRENSRLEQKTTDDGRIQTTSGTGEVRFTDIQLLDENNRPVETLETGSRVVLSVKIKAHHRVPRLVLGYMIKDRLGLPIFGSNTYHTEHILSDLGPGDTADYRISFSADIGPGSYSIAVALTSSENHLGNNYEWRDLAILFTVINSNRPFFLGSASLDTTTEIIRPTQN